MYAEIERYRKNQLIIFAYSVVTLKLRKEYLNAVRCNTPTPDEELNGLIHGTFFYVNKINAELQLSKSRVYGPPCMFGCCAVIEQSSRLLFPLGHCHLSTGS